jgi:uncharacterized membrane protein
MIKLIILIFIAEFLFTVGHVFFKKAANQLGKPSLQKGHRTYLVFVGGVLGLPAVWWGVTIIALALVVWLGALSKGELSLVYPLSSLQYLMTLIAASVFLKEKMDSMKIIGTLFIVAGIALMALSGS